MEVHGFYGISVYAAAGMTVEQLVGARPQLGRSRYRQLRSSTAGVIRGAGFRLLATLEWPHFDIELPNLSEATLERLGSCFGPPFPNPGR